MSTGVGELAIATIEPIRSSTGPSRRGLSLAETLIGVTILVGLFSIVVVSSRMAGSSSKRSTAQQELAQIATAISQYASFWPAWNINGTLVAQKGWPDFCPSRLFAVPPYTSLAGFNEAARVNFDVFNGITRYHPTNENYDIVSPGLVPDTATDISVLDANVALAYQLTAVAGKGPYLRHSEQVFLSDIQNDKVTSPLSLLNPPQNITEPLYPPNGVGASRAQALLDPWGTPLRYFWVHRPRAGDVTTGNMAYRGFLPVLTADPANANFRVADGFVLESAGPDRKFGNVWKIVPDPLPANFETTDADIKDAADNIIISP